MDARGRDELEREIRRQAELGDIAAAATAAIRGYGPELYGFLLAFERDELAAAEIFSDASERIWKGLAAFGWQCSFRTWAYTIARNAGRSHRRNARRRGRREQPLPEGSELSAIVEHVRTATLTYLQTHAKRRLAALRESLPRDDQELLVLRVDKRLGWNELAQVLHEGDEPLSESQVRREAARLRKRFQLVKERLLALGQREGLLGERERAP